MKLPLLCALLFVLVAVPVSAQPPGRGAAIDERMIARCIHSSARGKLWLEKTLWGLRDQEGGWIGAEVQNRNGSHDLGPMQINSRWAPRIGRLLDRPPNYVRRWLRDDGCFNVEAARWLLLTGLASSSGYWEAVGRYHSSTGWRQARYAANVFARLQRRYRATSPKR